MSWAALRHALRLTVAALLAWAVTSFFGLSQGYWAIMTTLIVMQSSVGGTLGAALDRVVGTIAGAGVGVVGALLQTVWSLPQVVVLVLASAPLAMLAMQRPSFRLAPITAVMILALSGSESSAVWTAVDRMFEIALGCVIGVLTAQFVLPARSRPAILASVASLLEVFGSASYAQLSRWDDTRLEPLSAQMRDLLTRIGAASAEERRERAVHLAAGPDTAPLLRTLRRLRSDVAILGRVMAVEDAPDADHTAIAAVLKTHFEQLAESVRRRDETSGLGALDAIIGDQPEAATLHFALVTLRRDLADLNERVTELIAAERGQ